MSTIHVRTSAFLCECHISYGVLWCTPSSINNFQYKSQEMGGKFTKQTKTREQKKKKAIQQFMPWKMVCEIRLFSSRWQFMAYAYSRHNDLIVSSNRNESIFVEILFFCFFLFLLVRCKTEIPFGFWSISACRQRCDNMHNCIVI